MNLPAPPFAGNAWEVWAVADGAPLPSDCTPIGPTAGGTLVKRRWGAAHLYDPPTLPAWRLTYRRDGDRFVRTVQPQESAALMGDA